jgi:hypothetical protein
MEAVADEVLATRGKSAVPDKLIYGNISEASTKEDL